MTDVLEEETSLAILISSNGAKSTADVELWWPRSTLFINQSQQDIMINIHLVGTQTLDNGEQK